MSKRRRRSPKPIPKTTRTSTPSPRSSPEPTRLDHPPAPDQRLDLQPTTTPEDRHRLATSANGSGGNGGNAADPVELLDRAAALLHLPPVVSDQPSVLRARAREYVVLTAEAVELESAAAELRNAEHAAGVVRRRIERERRSARLRAEREARRREGGLYAGQQRTPNRPVHVQVDPEAWATLKFDVIRRGRAVGSVVAELVNAAVDRPGLGQQTSQRGSTRPEPRFARLFIDDAAWFAFRAAASAEGLSAARAIGVIVEAEAHRLGWRPAPDDG